MRVIRFAMVLLSSAGQLLLAGPDYAQKPSTATATQPPTAEMQRLAALAQVWGFLKYHHPGLARPGLDWDSVRFLIW